MRGSLGELFSYLSADVQPPLYYLTVWGWVRAFGASEFGLRSLSALAGTLSLPVLYWGCRQLIGGLRGSRTGLLAAWMLACSPYHVHYSHEAKSYALLLLLAIGAFAAAGTAIRSGRNAPAWAAYVVLMTAATYVHVTAVFLLPAFVLFPWLDGYGLSEKAEAAPMRISQAAILALPGALFAPWFLWAGWSARHVGTAFSWAEKAFEESFPWQPLQSVAAYSPTAAPPLRNLMNLWSPGGWLWDGGEIAWLLLGALALAIAVALAGLKHRSRGIVPLLALATFPLAGLFAASFLRPIYLVGRSDAVALPFFLALCAAGACMALGSRNVWMPLLVGGWLLLAAPSLVMQHGVDARSQDKQLFVRLQTELRAGDTVVLPGLTVPTGMYYLEGPGRRAGADGRILEPFPAEMRDHPGWESPQAYDPEQLRREASVLARRVSGTRVFLLIRAANAPESILPGALEAEGMRVIGVLESSDGPFPRLELFAPAAEEPGAGNAP